LRGEDGWHERLVGLDPDDEGRFRFVASDRPVPMTRLLTEGVQAAPVGSIAEVCPAGQAIVADIAARITAAGGAALIIDYGATASAAGDSLQAVRNHAYHPVLEAPGCADLTAHVDFAALARAAASQGITAYGPVEQGDFLRRLGLDTRAAMLEAHADARQAQAIEAAKHRLTAPDAMGSLFKVLALAHPSLPPPPGFEES
jgi:NADH dehydrogenase [ubiquinone] 1 alpha subcomplex assembly factor 7